jgi:hypothetical protein
VYQFPVSATLLASNTVGPNNPNACAAAQKAAGPINSSIAIQLTQLPVPSATVGVVSLKRKGSDVPIPFDNLGPILTDRPDTVGKGHLFGGFSYQHFNFHSIDGVSLGALPVGYTFDEQFPNVSTTYTFYGSESNNIDFKLDQYVGLLTYGATPTTDISLIIPINSVSLHVTSSDFQAYLYDPIKLSYTNETPARKSITSTGSATGIGDVLLNLKQMIAGHEGERLALALGATFRFPSGDAYNYLGSGALGGSMYSLLEYRARVAPHAKVAYQWNDATKILDLSTGGSSRLPGGLQYAVGSDYRIARPVTIAVDFLGSQTVNTQSFTVTNVKLPPGTGAPSAIPGVNPFITTYTSVNFSGGVKWSPVPHLVLYANVLTQLNNVGLKADPVPLFGITYNYRPSK